MSTTLIKEYIVALVNATRDLSRRLPGRQPARLAGALPTGQAWAAMQGRDYVMPDDIKLLAEPVLAHRMIISPSARIRNVDTRTVRSGYGSEPLALAGMDRAPGGGSALPEVWYCQSFDGRCRALGAGQRAIGHQLCGAEPQRPRHLPAHQEGLSLPWLYRPLLHQRRYRAGVYAGSVTGVRPHANGNFGTPTCIAGASVLYYRRRGCVAQLVRAHGSHP
jgi:hypothetical protein